MLGSSLAGRPRSAPAHGVARLGTAVATGGGGQTCCLVDREGACDGDGLVPVAEGSTATASCGEWGGMASFGEQADGSRLVLERTGPSWAVAAVLSWKAEDGCRGLFTERDVYSRGRATAAAAIVAVSHPGRIAMRRVHSSPPRSMLRLHQR